MTESIVIVISTFVYRTQLSQVAEPTDSISLCGLRILETVADLHRLVYEAPLSTVVVAAVSLILNRSRRRRSSALSGSRQTGFWDLPRQQQRWRSVFETNATVLISFRRRFFLHESTP